MIYTNMTIKAMKLAYEAHHGQVDGSNTPYIFHPLHLAEQMKDEITCTVALLHDVVEDTDVTLEELQAQFPPEVTDAVALLTHDRVGDYFEYVAKIRNNPIAKAVKLADLHHNMDHSRNSGMDIPKERLEHWKNKYTKAMKILCD